MKQKLLNCNSFKKICGIQAIDEHYITEPRKIIKSDGKLASTRKNHINSTQRNPTLGHVYRLPESCMASLSSFLRIVKTRLTPSSPYNIATSVKFVSSGCLSSSIYHPRCLFRSTHTAGGPLFKLADELEALGRTH